MVKVDPYLQTLDHLRSEDTSTTSRQGSVTTITSLPVSANVGDIRQTLDTGLLYRYDGVSRVLYSTTYTLPIATASILGGVKKGDRISIDANGVISADVQGGGGDMLKATYDPLNLSKGLQPALTCVAKTANYTANPFELVNCDVSAASFKVTLPTAPADGTVIYVKLNGIGTNKYLTIATGGTDKFNSSTGTVEIYMYLFGEYAQMQYCSTTGIWTTFISAATYNFATQFPGIDATTPITNANITVNATARTLTIVPPLGYFNIFVDGGGVITRYRKVGNVVFGNSSGTSGNNTWTDTSGTRYFYLDNNGQPVTTQTPRTVENFSTIATIYRVIWNATLSGAAKLVSQYIEYHTNTISADDHKHMHLGGAIRGGGSGNFDAKYTTVAGTPNVSGVNTCISLTTGTNIDDNLAYTVTNNTTGNPFTQDMGNITPASITISNSGQFKIFTQDAGGLVSFLPATRFPFAWDTGTNRPQTISQTGTRTLVPDNRWFVYFVYATQNPVAGESIKLVSAPAEFTSLANAQAYNRSDIQTLYPTNIGYDNEIRVMYRCIFYNDNGGAGNYDVAVKYTALREVQDLRKQAVTNVGSVGGSLPASSVTVVPAGNIASTNVQAALEELDTEKVVANVAITGATKTKITYDAKGLVTAGADATTADIAASTNKNYITDAQQSALHGVNDANTTSNTYADGKVSDTAYDAGTRDTVTTIAPSKNAIRDKIVAMDSTISGKGVGDMLLGTAQSVTETKTFTKDKLLVKGTGTGTTNITTANTSSTSYTATLPAKDGTIAMTSDIGTAGGANVRRMLIQNM